MKKVDTDAAEKENLSNQEKSPEARKSKSKPAKVRKEKKVDDGLRLPVLVEFTYSMSTILLIALGLSMAMISFMTGATLLNLVLRTSVAVVVMGGLLMVISSQISSGVLSASLIEQEESRETESEDVENHANTETPVKAEIPTGTEIPAKAENQSPVEVE
jgi:hypothetical protein